MNPFDVGCILVNRENCLFILDIVKYSCNRNRNSWNDCVQPSLAMDHLLLWSSNLSRIKWLFSWTLLTFNQIWWNFPSPLIQFLASWWLQISALTTTANL